MQPLLRVRGLELAALRHRRSAPIVRDLSFEVGEGEAVALVGESGSGKSLTMLAVMGLLPAGIALTAGEVEFAGENLVAAGPRRLQELRGAAITMVYQDPMTSMNPMMPIGEQVAETLTAHGVSRAEAGRRALVELSRVGIPDPERTARAYPHEFSGGMRQRAMIASALVSQPRLLIADEPTTALDVTIQQQILALVRERQRATSMATIWVTHDLGVVAQLVDRVLVMYAGRIVEDAPVRQLFEAPQHPYTAALLASLPRVADLDRKPLVQIPGSPPGPGEPLEGCSFRPRCPQAVEKCLQLPPLLDRRAGRAACWLEPERWR